MGKQVQRVFRVSRPPEIDKQQEEEKMNRNGYRGSIWVALAILLTASLWAAAASSRTLSFRTPVKLNGAEMTPGFYEVQWVSHSPEATVTFRRNGQVVATAAGKWVERESKSPADSVVYSNNADGTHTLKELRFGGMKQALVFGEGS
jgi:hypothetical protein